MIGDRAGVAAGEKRENFGVKGYGLVGIVDDLIGLGQTGTRADDELNLGGRKR